MPQSISDNCVKVEGTGVNKPLPARSIMSGNVNSIYFQTNSINSKHTEETRDKMASTNTASNASATTTAKKAVPAAAENKEHKPVSTSNKSSIATTSKKINMETAFEDTEFEEEMVRMMVLREEKLQKDKQERLEICAKLTKLAREKGRKKAEKDEKENKEKEEIQACLDSAIFLEEWNQDNQENAKVINPNNLPAPIPSAKMPEGAEECWGMPGKEEQARHAAILPTGSAAKDSGAEDQPHQSTREATQQLMPGWTVHKLPKLPIACWKALPTTR